jgi:hypothetical protein
MVLRIWRTWLRYRFSKRPCNIDWRERECRYANGLGILELDGKIWIKNRKKDSTFAARKLMGQDHHRVFMYTPDLSASNQKDSPLASNCHYERCNEWMVKIKTMPHVFEIAKKIELDNEHNVWLKKHRIQVLSRRRNKLQTYSVFITPSSP